MRKLSKSFLNENKYGIKMENYKPTWAEIDLDKFNRNISKIRQKIPKSTKLYAVIKANGYGCGSVMLAKEGNADGYCVARLDEAVELRENSIAKEIIVLGYIPDEDIKTIFRYDLTPVVYFRDFADLLDEKAKEFGKEIRVHAKIDTGMHRLGVNADDALDFLDYIMKKKHLKLSGVFSHFSVADEADKSYTEWQFSRLKKIIDKLKGKDIMFHTANSAAIIDLENTYLNMVRAGIMIYGLYPSDEVMKQNIRLEPILSLKTTVAYVKYVEQGSSVSYVRTYKAKKRTKIVTLPIGYADGYNRLLSNKGEVLISGKRYPVAGNVCMDMIMADVGDDDIRIGDEAVLIGKQGDEEIIIEEIAKKTGTINYEVQCAISRRVPRAYLKGNKIIEVKKYLGA